MSTDASGFSTETEVHSFQESAPSPYATPHVAERFEPASWINDRLAEESKKLVGFVLYEVKWRQDRGCLCLLEKDKRGFVSIRKELRDDVTDAPRQAHLGDVNEAIDAIRRRVEAIEKFIPKMFAKQKEIEQKARENTREVAEATVKELVRVVNEGVRTYVDLGASTGEPGEQTSITVTDRRPKYD
jgi:hypothetical protein